MSRSRVLNSAICFGRIRTISPVPSRNMPTASWHWYVCPGIWDYHIFSDPVALLNLLLPILGEGSAPGGGGCSGLCSRHRQHAYTQTALQRAYLVLPLAYVRLSLGQPEPWGNRVYFRDHLQVLSPAVPSDLSSLATNLFGCRDSCSLWQGSFGDICASLRDWASDCLEQG